MPVYTVHAPSTNGTDLRTIDRFAFVRDGFHFWALLLGPVWLAWHRLWLALLGWMVMVFALDLGMAKLGAGGAAIFCVNALIALLMGFEASSLWRWTLSRHHWRQLDIVVAADEEAAERRFFERWNVRQRTPELASVDRGGPPPTRDSTGQPFSRPLPQNSIIGLFPEPGGSR